MWIGRQTPGSYAVAAILGFLLSALMAYSWWSFDGIPPRSELHAASGRVVWVEDGRYSIRFRLDGVPRSLTYASKGGAMGAVYDALSNAGQAEVQALVAPDDSESPVHAVYELSVAGQPVRTHQQVSDAWQFDENLAGWMAIVFAACAFYCLACMRSLSRSRMTPLTRLS